MTGLTFEGGVNITYLTHIDANEFTYSVVPEDKEEKSQEDAYLLPNSNEMIGQKSKVLAVFAFDSLIVEDSSEKPQEDASRNLNCKIYGAWQGETIDFCKENVESPNIIGLRESPVDCADVEQYVVCKCFLKNVQGCWQDGEYVVNDVTKPSFHMYVHGWDFTEESMECAGTCSMMDY